MRSTISVSLCVAALSLAHPLLGCCGNPDHAIAVLAPTKGNTVYGTVHFTESADGVRVQADIHSLTPGKHGFHIHEFGDMSSEDGMATGGHFNPTKAEHKGCCESGGHAGDFGNIVADANGDATLDIVSKALKMGGGESCVGRGVIVHAGEDDLKSQPSGNAGARVAQGVIGFAKPVVK